MKLVLLLLTSTLESSGPLRTLLHVILGSVRRRSRISSPYETNAEADLWTEPARFHT